MSLDELSLLNTGSPDVEARTQSAAGGPFDLRAYWRGRMEKHPPLQATGTLPFDELYQRWLYRLKERAIDNVLSAARLDLFGRQVINLGCGHGYFERFFASRGATRITGVDFVESAIARLTRDQPAFEYLVADLGGEVPAALKGRTFDLVSAIDVLYHIVDDATFERALSNACALCARGGVLLWTDAPGRSRRGPQGHCRYRALNDYLPTLSAHGFSLVADVPMYCLLDVENSFSRWAARHPRVIYPGMYVFDCCFASWGLRRTANHCYAAVRSGR